MFAIWREMIEDNQQDKNISVVKARKIYLKVKADAETILTLEMDPIKLSPDQLEAILTPLKRKLDGAIPTLKAKKLKAYKLWKDRL